MLFIHIFLGVITHYAFWWRKNSYSMESLARHSCPVASLNFATAVLRGISGITLECVQRCSHFFIGYCCFNSGVIFYFNSGWYVMFICRISYRGCFLFLSNGESFSGKRVICFISSNSTVWGNPLDDNWFTIISQCKYNFVALYFTGYLWKLWLWFKTRIFDRARWLRGNARDSHSGGPGFKSRCDADQPDWGFLLVFLNHQGKFWVGFSLPRSLWPLFIKFIYHKMNSVILTIETLTTQQ